jgi:hypothetical protein
MVIAANFVMPTKQTKKDEKKGAAQTNVKKENED